MSITDLSRARWPALAASALILAGCLDTQAPERAAVEYQGSAPGAATGAATGATTPPGPAPGSEAAAVTNYGDYVAARARAGDTVASLAERIGMSAAELGAYNGLSPSHRLRAGDELVLPPRPSGQAARTGPARGDTGEAAGEARASAIETQSLDAGPTDAAEPSPGGTGSGWSPDIAAAAIDRSAGGGEATARPGQGGDLETPPSREAPLPANLAEPRALDSPDLSQYQTPRAETPPDEDTGVVAALPDRDAPEPRGTDAPAGTRLERPVDGPVAVGFGSGAGQIRNDGVDFAVAPGTPVRAAADGEIALVSEALGGLGTIVLIRHPDGLLTVYGRIAGVTLTKGDKVRRGQRIGRVAKPEPPAEGRMHFEVRRGAESLDPMRFI